MNILEIIRKKFGYSTQSSPKTVQSVRKKKQTGRKKKQTGKKLKVQKTMQTSHSTKTTLIKAPARQVLRHRKILN